MQTSAAAAASYFGEQAGEYYADGTAAGGVWGGTLAGEFGLAGRVEPGAFARVCENRHPATGEPLTPRTRAARRVGFDLNFHCPKSVSVLYGLTGDAGLLAAFRDAVARTMSEVEGDARARVRAGGRDADRVTGSLLWATFVHATARPVGGVSDPHLHAHCFALNLTRDPVEGRLKALQPEGLYRSARYFEAVFHARLARSLRDQGYDIHQTRTGWEVAGVPVGVNARFSRRTAVIERLAAELGITDPGAKAALGARTRERKDTARSLADLRAEWWSRLTPDERAAVGSILSRDLDRPSDDPAAGRDALRFATDHVFERAAVVPVRRLLEVALRAGVGGVTPETLAPELGRGDILVRELAGERMATTAAVLAEERELVRFARDGRGACRPLITVPTPPHDRALSAEQRAVVRHVLTSADRVVLVRGAAGTGKTTLLGEVVAAVSEAGRAVVLLAPSAEAARGVLRADGFADADTVARFLTDEGFQRRARGKLVWVDEAGLLGSRDAARLFRVAAAVGARVVLAGDRHQHRSVARGDVLRLLEAEAGLTTAQVTTIRRQRGRYRDAVRLLSRGQAADGLDALDALGWVREVNDADRAGELAAEYLATVKAGKTALVVSPTHAEGRSVTTAIRAALFTDGRLTGDDRAVGRLDARDLTAAERGRAASFHPGDVVEFHSRAAGFRAGDRLTVTQVGRAGVGAVTAAGQPVLVPLKQADRFQVYTAHNLPLAVGDRVRVTKNARVGGRRLDNGSLHAVAGFTPGGGVRLASGAVLPAGFGHLSHGYVLTSHASQGKTVDRVLIAVSSLSFRAAGREQLYVSVSRGRERATVFTDDRRALRRAVERFDRRPTATELAAAGGLPPPLWRAWVVRRLRSVRAWAVRVVEPAVGRGVPRELRP